ncbi:dipeptidase [Granulicella arctica]|uniref:dipeptidase n=1 Tax=Granulicella arctica TaxID=940613 RepID=UPI0021E04AA3|nr:dipeptidase [Granulicella arctica]
MITRRSFLGYSPIAPLALRSILRAVPETSAPRVSARAIALHKRTFIFDGHVHALDREFYHGGSFGTQSTEGQWDLVRAAAGGEGAFFLSIFVPEEYYPGRFETRQALRRIDHALQQIALNHNKVELALTAEDIRHICARGKMAAILDIEGSYDLDGDPGILRDLYKLGLRSAQLSAHNWNQNYADACCSSPQSNGLTQRGRELIQEMNRLGMVINISHSSDQTISQAIDASDHPVIATHGGLRSANNIPRLMSDDLLKKLASKGGVFGFQIGGEFASRRVAEYLIAQRNGKSFTDTTSIPDRVKGKTIEQVDILVAPGFPMAGPRTPDNIAISADEWVDVVDRAIQLVGEDHVSFGSDFDGGPPLPRGMRDVRDLPLITDAMLHRGYSEERIAKFWGGNLLRVFRQITQT